MVYYDIVDDYDNVVSKTIRKRNANYRFVNTILITDNNKLVIPVRSYLKTTFPNCYDFSAGGQVESGEDYLMSAYRQLKEKLFIKNNINLQEIAYLNPRTNNSNSFSKIFIGRIEGKIKKFNKREILSVNNFSLDEISSYAECMPHKVNPHLIKALDFLKNFL